MKLQPHRQVVQDRIVIRLQREHVVHHINGDHDDDRPENLLVVSSRVHSLLHSEGYWFYDPHEDAFVSGPVTSWAEVFDYDANDWRWKIYTQLRTFFNGRGHLRRGYKPSGNVMRAGLRKLWTLWICRALDVLVR